MVNASGPRRNDPASWQRVDTAVGDRRHGTPRDRRSAVPGTTHADASRLGPAVSADLTNAIPIAAVSTEPLALGPWLATPGRRAMGWASAC